MLATLLYFLVRILGLAVVLVIVVLVLIFFKILTGDDGRYRGENYPGMWEDKDSDRDSS